MEQPELGSPLPARVAYGVNGEAWRCNHFDLLAAEGLVPGRNPSEELAKLHELLSPQARPWMIVRRLYGIQPMLPPKEFSQDDFRTWDPGELAAALGITRPQLKAELAGARGHLTRLTPQPIEEPVPVAKPEPRDDFHFAEEELLRKHGFSDLKLPMGDRAWFAQRVRDYDKLLAEKMTAFLARSVLMTELHLRKLDAWFMDPTLSASLIGGEEYRKNMKVRQDMAATYEKQLGQINELAPWASVITGKYAFTGVISDITKAIRNYRARGDTRLIDGVFTATEIRVECRRSVQAPDPRYRAGLVVFVNAAKAGLWDPNWKNPFTAAELRKLDVAWQAAAVAAGNEAGEAVPDLEKDTEEGEYEPLKSITEKTSAE